MHGPITSVLQADAVRYERREAEKRSQISRRQEGHQGPGGREEQEGSRGPDGPFGSAEWRRDSSGSRRGAACRVNLSAAFEAVKDVAQAGAALSLDS